MVFLLELQACGGYITPLERTSRDASAATAEGGIAAYDAAVPDAGDGTPSAVSDARAPGATATEDAGATVDAGAVVPDDSGTPGQDAGMTRDAGRPPQEDAAIADGKVCILPLGDSITASDYSHLGWRYWLWDSLTREQYSIDMVGSQDGRAVSHPEFPNPNFDADHEAYPGYQTAQVLELLPGVLPKYALSYALIHLGTNDVGYRTNPPQDVANQLGQIIDLLRGKNPDVAVLLAQIIPSTWQGAAERIPVFNAQVAALAASKSTARSPVVLVDQFTGFDAVADTQEGTHPNESGDKKMALRWHDALVPLLGQARPCK